MLGMHGLYASNQAVTQCDVLFSIGTRFSDRITGKLSEFATHAEIIHVDIEPAAISRNIPVKIPIVGDAKAVIEQLLPLVDNVKAAGPWVSQINAWKKENPPIVVPGNSRLSPMEVIRSIAEVYPDAIVSTDVGQHQMWTSMFYPFKKSRTLLTSGGLGTMGYGFPAAVGAQIGNPGRKVVCISGDGSFQMNLQELATAVQEELPVIVAIFNNNYLGMVRQWQELFQEKRYSGTCLRHRRSCAARCNKPGRQCPPYVPDFVKLAESYGAVGLRVNRSQDIVPALRRAGESANCPVVIEFIIEQEANVMPMVPSGKALHQMLIEGGN